MENELLYYNGYGGFSKDGKEYVIKTKEKTTPAPWSHVIANENFGTIVTANGGGYIWHGNSQSNKITSWSNDCLRDTPSERLVLKMKNREINLLPYESLEKYTVFYGFGYAKYIYEDEELSIETLIYVPINGLKKVYEITIDEKLKKQECIQENEETALQNNDTENSWKIEYTLVPVLGVSREFTKKHIVMEKRKQEIVFKNKYRDNYAEDDVIVTTSENITQVSFDDTVLKMNMSINKLEKSKIQIEIGCRNKNIIIEENELQNVSSDLEEIEKFWKEKMKNVKIATPIESMNLLMNGWLLYQTLCCRMWARTSFYQAGGAFGFRDQLQDSLSILWFDSNITRKQILYHAAHQFEEGDVLHWWHQEKNNGTRTRYSDDLLWLPYVLSKYVEFTGDVQILEERVPYVKSEILREDEVERYTNVEITAYNDTLYDHAKKAIKFGVNLSENGLPKMNGGDWNDGMNKIKGQSIWLGFFVYTVLDGFKKICEIKKDDEKKEEYEKILITLKNSLNEYGWDGKWYRRAYFETGEPVGSAQNDECKIDGISQSWAVISGAGDIEKCAQGMDSLDSYLVDKENMIIKLLTPPFDKIKLNPGYIKEYIPGVRENGGQYTHGAIWSVIANAILKDGNRAGEYFRILNPIEHARTKENALRYKVEPYVMAADVYASPRMIGRGGWTWYTGSSSWFYIAGLEYILGIKKRANALIINPCIPHDWEEMKIEYLYQETKYRIVVKNPNQKSTGITSISFDNDFIQTNEVTLQNDRKEHIIEIVM
ncbi:MAG: hypothetical protein IJ220_06890 [Clostridia bacterium]|nr:hypothetical protein [Clostridia bacterium]